MDVGVVVEAERTYGAAGFGAADCALHLKQRAGLRLSGNLAVNDGLHLCEFIGKTKLEGAVHMLEHYVVVNGNVAGGLVSHVDVVSLGGQADERAAH